METLRVNFLEKLYFGEKKFAIVFPNNFELGSANLAPHILFRQLNEHGLADLFFLDSDGGIRTGLPLNDFDVILFTLPYEIDFINVIKILEKYNIPALREKRKEIHPIVVAGGVTVTSNPFPIFPFIDIFLLGESEAILEKFLSELKGDKKEVLERAKTFDFAVIPELKSTGKRAFQMKLDEFLSYSAFIDKSSIFGETFLAEIVRGCPWKCRFCLLSYITLPPRSVPIDRIFEVFSKYLKDGMPVGLVGSALGDHPEFPKILKFLQNKASSVSVSSLRIETISREVLELLRVNGMKTLTVAPEAGTERLRWVINKPIRDFHIERMSAFAREVGILKIKAYFMAGLPTETEEDIRGIGETVKLIRDNFKGPVSVTVSPFVPKPHTPFEKEPMWQENVLKRRLRKLKIDPRVKVSIGSPRLATIQAILSRGDEEIGKALYFSFKNGIGLLSAMKKLGLAPEKYLFDKSYLENAPYHKIQTGVTDWFLNFEHERALKGKILGPCKTDTCTLCGVCKPESS